MLTLSWPDKPGIMSAVSSFLVQHAANILARQQYGDSPDGRSCTRVRFSVPAQDDHSAQELQLARLERGSSWVAGAFHMTCQLHDEAARVRTPTMISRLGCPASEPTGQESLRRR